MKKKIFLFQAGYYDNGDVTGSALAEDGTVLAGHLSSDVPFLKYDLGLTSTRKHDAYHAHYPDGFELVWLDDPEGSPDFNAAVSKAKSTASAIG